jgi:hypothetical protein
LPFIYGWAPLLALLVLALVVWVWGRLGAFLGRRATQRVLDDLEPEGAADTDSGFVSLEGVVRCDGPVARPDDGEPVAVATLEASRRRFWLVPTKPPLTSSSRAERLWLECDGEAVPLVGPVTAVSGSRHWWPGRKWKQLRALVKERLSQAMGQPIDDHAMGNQRGVLRTVKDGDPVRVRGWIARATSDAVEPGGSYRERAVRRELRARGGEGITVAAVEPAAFVAPVRSRLLTVQSLVVGVLLLGATAVAIANYRWHERVCAGQCAHNGECAVVVELGPLPDLSCAPRLDEHCRSSMVCESLGRCSMQGTRCAAVTDADCAETRDCRIEGRCSAVDGECVIAKRSDCARTSGCRAYGRCSPHEGRCMVRTAADCAQSARCRDGGFCRPYRNDCVLSKAEACERGPACRDHGLCAAQGDRCVARDDDHCRKSNDCKVRGHCGMIESDEDRWCGAVSEEDCAASVSCHDWGLCTLDGGRCVADDESCRLSKDCVARGFCSARDGRCVNPLGEDRCRATTGCVKEGKCTLVEGRCRAGGSRDCRQAEICIGQGRCTAVDGICLAVTDVDCSAATICTQQGRCRAVRGVCE